MLNILSFRVVVKLVDAESSMYLMDFFYWLILSGRIQGHEQYTGPAARHKAATHSGPFIPLDKAAVLFMFPAAPE